MQTQFESLISQETRIFFFFNTYFILYFSRNAVYSFILQRSANLFRIIDFSRNDEYSFVGRSNSIKQIFFFFLIYISYRISQETRMLSHSRTKCKFIPNHLKKHEYSFVGRSNSIKRIFFSSLIYISYRISQETRIFFHCRIKCKLISNDRLFKNRRIFFRS